MFKHSDLTPTASPVTQDAYRRRAQLLIMRYQKETTRSYADDPALFARWITGLQPSLLKQTWKAYRVAVTFYLRELNAPLEAIVMIDAARNHSLCKKQNQASRKTSSKKLKRFPRNDIITILQFLNSPEALGPNDRTIALLLGYGIALGLRPSEWMNATLVTEPECEAMLLVKNAKHSNDRAHGPFRTLRLGLFSIEEIEIIRLLIDLIHPFVVSGRSLDEIVRQRLYDVTRRLWPRRKVYPTFYSTRHQFAANAKASGITSVELAAMMGHASDRTAKQHYARRVSGSPGACRVRAELSEMAVVRQSEGRPSKPDDPSSSIEPA